MIVFFYTTNNGRPGTRIEHKMSYIRVTNKQQLRSVTPTAHVPHKRKTILITVPHAIVNDTYDEMGDPFSKVNAELLQQELKSQSRDIDIELICSNQHRSIVDDNRKAGESNKESDIWDRLHKVKIGDSIVLNIDVHSCPDTSFGMDPKKHVLTVLYFPGKNEKLARHIQDEIQNVNLIGASSKNAINMHFLRLNKHAILLEFPYSKGHTTKPTLNEPQTTDTIKLVAKTLLGFLNF